MLIVLLSFYFIQISPLAAGIDPIHEEGNELLETGIYARSSASAKIKKYNITSEVSKLYKEFKPKPKKGVRVSYVGNDCFSLVISTKDGIPQFISQISIIYEECLNH